MQNIQNQQKTHVPYFEKVVKVVNAVSIIGERALETFPFLFLKKPGVQTACGLLILGYGVSQIPSGQHLCRMGLSLGGIVLYYVDQTHFRNKRYI